MYMKAPEPGRAHGQDLRRQRAAEQAVKQQPHAKETPASSAAATAIRAVIIVVWPRGAR